MNLIAFFLIAALGRVSLATTVLAYQAGNTEQMKSSVDFETYRTVSSPSSSRPGKAVCGATTVIRDGYASSLGAAIARKFVLDSGTITLEFKIVSDLITPGNPMKSRLLLHPLSPQEGGDPTHTGGKFWKSKGDPEWRMLADWVRAASQMAQRVLTPRRLGSTSTITNRGRATLLKGASGTRSLLWLPCSRWQELSSRAFVSGHHELDRRTISSKLPECSAADHSWRSNFEPTPNAPTRTRSRRRSVPFRRKAVCIQKRSRLARNRPMGARRWSSRAGLRRLKMSLEFMSPIALPIRLTSLIPFKQGSTSDTRYRVAPRHHIFTRWEQSVHQ